MYIYIYIYIHIYSPVASFRHLEHIGPEGPDRRAGPVPRREALRAISNVYNRYLL